MAAVLPLVLVPGLLCSARLYAPQIAALWPFGPITVADHRRDSTMAAKKAKPNPRRRKRQTLKEALLSMPNVGTDRDFARVRQRARPVRI